MKKFEAPEGYVTPGDLADLTGQKPQAIYGIMRQGYLAFEDVEVTVTKPLIPQEVADEYIAKRAERAAKRELEAASDEEATA